MKDNTYEGLRDRWIKAVKCPACNKEALFVGSGGYITCSHLDCPNPDYAETITQKVNEAERRGIQKAYQLLKPYMVRSFSTDDLIVTRAKIDELQSTNNDKNK